MNMADWIVLMLYLLWRVPGLGVWRIRLTPIFWTSIYHCRYTNPYQSYSEKKHVLDSSGAGGGENSIGIPTFVRRRPCHFADRVGLFNVRAARNGSMIIRFLNSAAQGEFNWSSLYSTVQFVPFFLTPHSILWSLLAGWQRNVTFSSPSWKSFGLWTISLTALPCPGRCAADWLFAGSRICL